MTGSTTRWCWRRRDETAGPRGTDLGQRSRCDVCVPAPGQGIVAIEIRDDDRDVTRARRRRSTMPSPRSRLTAERALVAALGGGCQLPLGAIARARRGDRLDMHAVVASPDGSGRFAGRRAADRAEPRIGRSSAREAADELAARGAARNPVDATQEPRGRRMNEAMPCCLSSSAPVPEIRRSSASADSAVSRPRTSSSTTTGSTRGCCATRAPTPRSIDVGAAAPKPLEQEAICFLLAEKAREGKTVVRLKWGDPFVFDSGGKEALFLHEQGIPFEVVPGSRQRSAAPAYAGIPVTYPEAATTS